jgi:hypothetical protein
MQLLPDLEAGHPFPVRRGQRQAPLDDPLAEALELRQPLRVDGPDAVEVERPAREQDARDHGGVGRPVDVVPGRVHRRHRQRFHRGAQAAGNRRWSTYQ